MTAQTDATTRRSCGGCTKCCELVPVEEIGLPAFTRCAHIAGPPAAKQGCGVYSNRPTSCRRWSCLWLLNRWDDDLRPDRCGIVFDQMPDIVTMEGKERACYQAWVAPGREDDWNKQPALAVVLAIVNRELVVLFRTSAKSAFVVWQENGRLCHRRSTQPTSMEPDRTRLRRAAQLVAEMP